MHTAHRVPQGLHECLEQPVRRDIIRFLLWLIDKEETWMKRLIVITCLMLVVLINGCATVPMASLADDEKAKSFMVDAGKSNIYVYRNEIIGGAITMPVTLDGKVVGKTGPKTYIKLTVMPGYHEIASITENTSKLDINTKAGSNYFIWQEVKFGTWTAKSELHIVSEEEGRAGVNECKLIAPDI